MRSITLVTIGFAAIVAAICSKPVCAGPNLLKDFKDQLATAEKLESSELLLGEQTQKSIKDRRDLIYFFARQAKSSSSEKYFEAARKISDEFRIKAHQFVEESKQSKNWIANIIKIGNPLQALRNLAKNNQVPSPFLNTIVDRYAEQVKQAGITDDDISCDVTKFDSMNLHSILFVIQTDIKYLLIEDQQVQNQAIYEQLKADKFVSTSNFFDGMHELNTEQRGLLLEFYSDRVNQNEVNLSQALDHFQNPSEFVIGRLIDTCQAAILYQEQLKELEQSYDDVCSKSTSDPAGNKLFPNQFKFDKYDAIFEFCQNFLNALWGCSLT